MLWPVILCLMRTAYNGSTSLETERIHLKCLEPAYTTSAAAMYGDAPEHGFYPPGPTTQAHGHLLPEEMHEWYKSMHEPVIVRAVLNEMGVKFTETVRCD